MDDFEMPTVEDMQQAFGILPDDSGGDDTGANTEPEVDQAEGTSENNEEADQFDQNDQNDQVDQNNDQVEQQVQQQQSSNQKQNQAFARMRSENSQMQKTLQQMAQILGLDPKMPMAQLNEQLQAQALNALAKQQNVNPELLQRLDNLEQINAEYTRIKLESKITDEFRTIKEKYGATDDDINAFSQELINEGVDPNNNLELEFLQRNFSAIQQRAIDNAVNAEQTRAAKAGGASKPQNKQGQNKNSEPHDINSVEELNDFFSKLE